MRAGSVSGVTTLTTSDKLIVGGGGAQVTGGLIVQSEGLGVTGTTTLRHEVTALQAHCDFGSVSLGAGNVRQNITDVQEIDTTQASIGQTLTVHSSGTANLNDRVLVNVATESAEDVAVRGETVLETSSSSSRVRVLDGGVEIRAGSDAAGYKELKVLPSRVEMRKSKRRGQHYHFGHKHRDLTAQRGTFGKQVTVQIEGLDVTGSTHLHGPLDVDQDASLQGKLVVSDNLATTEKRSQAPNRLLWMDLSRSLAKVVPLRSPPSTRMVWICTATASLVRVPCRE